MAQYVIYRRVSTTKQGETGLGLEAQQAAIQKFIESTPDSEVIATFEEVETGTNKRKRPKLHEALAVCKAHNATLVVATLSRLSRNVHFISGLVESKVNFIALDCPSLDRTMLYFQAVMAEWEASVISKRTKDALAMKRKWYAENAEELKEKGLRYKLGNPQNLSYEARGKALAQINTRKKAKAEEFKKEVLPVVLRKKLEGKTLMQIAEELNRDNYKRPSGRIGGWDATTVRRVML